MRAQSPRTKQARAEAKPIRDLYLEAFPFCEFERAGAPGRCLGGLHVHEAWTRGRGGPIDDPRNFASACDMHNTWVSQTVEGQRFGYRHALLVRRRDGASWLEGGGRCPGLTFDQAVAGLRRLTGTA